MIRKMQPFTYVFLLLGFVNFFLYFNNFMYAFVIALIAGSSFFLLLRHELKALKRDILLRHVDNYMETILSKIREQIPSDILEITLKRPRKTRRYYLFCFLSTPKAEMIEHINSIMHQYLSTDISTAVIDGFIVVEKPKDDHSFGSRFLIFLEYEKLRWRSFIKKYYFKK